MRRAIFRRGLKYAAVKPVRFLDRTFNPGDEVVGLKTHHLRWLWRRGRIGVVGDQWTSDKVKAWQERTAVEQQFAAEQAACAAAAPQVVTSPSSAAAVVEPPPPSAAPAKPVGPRRVRRE